MRSGYKIISFSVLLALISCNLEVNTADPQVSVSEAASKRNGFFINSYYSHNSQHNLINLEFAWIEYCWKQEATLFKVSKVKTQGLQLNLKVKNLNAQLDKKKYLTNWRMEVDKLGVMGRSEDVYTLYLNNSHIPDSLTVRIKVKLDDGFVERDLFGIYKEIVK